MRTNRDQLVFSKKARAVEYNPCTLGEYRRQKPKEYVELAQAAARPQLGDDLVAKRANAERVREFSKNLKSINMGHMAMKGATPAQEAAAQRRTEAVSKRERMREFARHRVVQAARAPPPPPDDDDDEPIGSGARAARGGRWASGDGTAVDGAGERGASLLEDLEMRHDAQRAQVEAIRREMGFDMRARALALCVPCRATSDHPRLFVADGRALH